MTKKNPGKIFEEDFQRSAEKEMFIYRLKDPPASFNLNCKGCPKQVSRFSVKNICDFMACSNGTQYLLELKSHKGKSIPFPAIVKDYKDTRLLKMVTNASRWKMVMSFVIFNWRDIDNETYAVHADKVLDFIDRADRKSIPYEFTTQGIRIEDKIRISRYSYSMEAFVK